MGGDADLGTDEQGMGWHRRAGRRIAGIAVTAVALVPSSAAAAERSCAGNVQVSGGQVNVLYPDENATYWGTRVPLPEGGHIELTGQFPHARYMSLISYTSPDLSAIDIVRDAEIVPEPGSTNPFLPAADRAAAKRDFTLRVARGKVPDGAREPNTLYTESADGEKSAGNYVQMLLRIYLPDLGTGLSGGVPLPDVTVVLASGQRIAYPSCPSTDLPDAGATEALAAQGPGVPMATPMPASPEPRWHRYMGGGAELVRQTDNPLTGSTVYPLLKETLPPPQQKGGLGDTPDNRYIYTVIGADRGQIFAIRAKAPTHPTTSNGAVAMGSGDVRYWSMCSNLSTTQFLACRYDEQIPLDGDGFYTIVVSTAAARPRNAIESCGVTWLPAGPAGRTVLALRNLLPDPSFRQSTHDARPDTEEHDMGPYHPGGRYYATTADFERTGCRR